MWTHDLSHWSWWLMFECELLVLVIRRFEFVEDIQGRWVRLCAVGLAVNKRPLCCVQSYDRLSILTVGTYMRLLMM